METNNKDLELKKLRERVVNLERSLEEFESLKETSREQESELYQSEKRFSQVAESAGEWIWEIDAQGLYTFSSPAVESIIGYTPDDIVGKKYFYELIVPESRKRLKEAAFKLFQERKSFKDLKIPNLHKDGSKVISEVSGVPIISEDKQFIGYRGLDFDITPRVMYEKALKKSKRQLHDIIDHLPDATLAINLDGEVIAWNKAIETMTGVKAADIMGKADYEYAIPFYGNRRPILIDLIFKSEEEIKKMHYLGIHKEGQALMAETTLPAPRGIKSYLWGKASPLYDENGELMGAVESIRDITYRKKAEKKLRESEEKYRTIFEKSGIPIIFVEADSTISLVNREFEHITGYRKEEVEGKLSFTEFVATPAEKKMMLEYHRLRRMDKDTAPVSYEFHFQDKAGNIKNALVNASVIPGTSRSLVALMDITERKKAERELQESKDRFQQVVENAEEWIWEVDEQGLYTYTSPVVEKILGYSTDEIVGIKHFYDFFTPENREYKKNSAFNIFNKRESFSSFINHNMHKNGETVILETSGVPFYDEHNKFKGYRGVDNDITSQKKAENDLILSKNHFQNIFDHAPIGIFHTSLEGKVYEANQALIDILHYDSVDEFISNVNKSSLQETVYVKGEDRKRLVGGIIGDQGWHDYEFPLKRKDGKIITVELTARPVRDSKGDVEYIEGFIKDITERKATLMKLHRSEERFRAVAESAADAILTTDSGGEIILFNQSLLDIFGYTREEMLHQPVSILIPPSLRDNFQRRFSEFRITGKHVLSGKTFKSTGLRKDGTEFPFEMSLATWESQGEKYNTSIIRDITHRWEAEKELKESQNKLKVAMDLAKLVHWEYDFKSDLFHFDDQFYSLYGTTTNSIGGATMSPSEYADKFIPLEEAELVGVEMAKALETDDPDYNGKIEHTIIRADGERRTILVKYGVIKDENGKTIGTYGANQDITERVEAEKSIKESLKEKELLLQEIHHRVKNNLQIISSLLNLQESYVNDPETVEVLKESQNRVLSMAMIHEMLYNSEDLSTINFLEYIQNLVYDLFNSYILKTDKMQLNLQVDDIYLNIETAVPLGLIISELVSNCLKYAFPEDKKGMITIDFHMIKEGEYQLIIEDDGVGLPQDIDMETTESLGLRLVESLVNQLDGTVELQRKQGTKYLIRFRELEYMKRI